MTASPPIAVIGIGCRFPFSDGAEAFWRNLAEGRSCVGEIPADRWDVGRFAGAGPAIAGRSYCLQAGMDAQGDRYDADFFGLDAGERERMDPQQGMALELAWHACEDAGLAPDTLAGEPVGVFVGVSTRDFDRRMANRWQHIDMATSTGASGAIVANRISYLLGLTGPSLAVDGACTSSLMSLHLACRAIADGECDLALAGGVQLILSPANMIAFAQAGALARDGRCKPFAADADGYVCGEGGGMVALKRLDLALAHGDRIRAVVRGSAINHNGRSNGMSAPYRQAQAQVMRAALARAQVDPASVGYVEAHAVGTLIGDAIEMQAIRDVYDRDRAAGQDCFVGSVKANIGHLEASAGIASFIKTVLMLERDALPPGLHCATPSKLLRLEQGALRLCDAAAAWPRSDGPRRAGVSAFSFGGSNAHLVLEQAPLRERAPASDQSQDRAEAGAGARIDARGPWLLAVSAADAGGLRRLREAYAGFAATCRDRGEPLSVLRDFCASTLAHRRVAGLRRAWVVRDWEQAVEALRATEAIEADDAASATAPGEEWRIALTAQDAPVPQWPRLEQALAGLDPASRGLLRPIALLAQLGLPRIAVEGDSDAVRALAAYAAGLGIAATPYAAGPLRAGVPIVSVRPSDAHTAAQAAIDGQEALTRLCAQLLLRGAPVRWSGYAELLGAHYLPLPLYPFQRRRQHLLLDEIAPVAVAVAASPMVETA